ncbi:MAG: sodium:proline symporter, partial [Clostridia bacterium]|nr:sodium:proline symporter [Clostridia bacterium]
FQGLLMLAALMIVPIVALFILNASGALAPVSETQNYYNLLSSGEMDWASVSNILTGLGWGLGYFGMPHILVRYMAVKSEKEMKKSQIIGPIWTALILTMATVVGIVGHEYLGSSLEAGSKNLVFVNIVRNVFGFGALAFFGGILISAIVAASMSTADSQLLASASAFASDFYKTTIKKDASDKRMLVVGRITVAVISAIALVLSLLVLKFELGGIMELVSAAWSIFGSAFGPVILLSLYWKRLNYKGACAGIISGFLSSLVWMVLFNLPYYGFPTVIADTGLYEIVPGFIIGLLVTVIVSLATEKPSDEVAELCESVDNFSEEE